MNSEKEQKIKSFKELCENIDWELLRKQKETLLIMMNKAHNQIELDDLEGILNLIDSIQDLAVDYYEIPEEKVFLKEDDEEQVINISNWFMFIEKN